MNSPDFGTGEALDFNEQDATAYEREAPEESDERPARYRIDPDFAADAYRGLARYVATQDWSAV